MSTRTLHQFSDAASSGDAITDHIFLLRRWLRELGFRSDIYAQQIDPRLAGEVRPVHAYAPRAEETHVIYHHSIGSSVADRLLTLPLRQIMVYHNITPPEFFADLSEELVRQLSRGRAQLALLREVTDLALGVSPFNERELIASGYADTGVLPLTLDLGRYNIPSNRRLTALYQGDRPLLLFVGRLAPNKKQEDLIKLLYYSRQITPTARLLLVGAGWLPAYERWLRDLTCDLGLADNVIFTGHVSQEDMVTYYRLADVYVSMSEHEGFGKPFLESMYVGLPVLAYAAGGVPGTLGGSGILFREKNYRALAELVDILLTDDALRARVLAGQRKRIAAFSETAVRERFTRHLQRLAL